MLGFYWEKDRGRECVCDFKAGWEIKILPCRDSDAGIGFVLWHDREINQYSYDKYCKKHNIHWHEECKELVGYSPAKWVFHIYWGKYLLTIDKKGLSWCNYHATGCGG